MLSISHFLVGLTSSTENQKEFVESGGEEEDGGDGRAHLVTHCRREVLHLSRLQLLLFCQFLVYARQHLLRYVANEDGDRGHSEVALAKDFDAYEARLPQHRVLCEQRVIASMRLLLLVGPQAFEIELISVLYDAVHR